eukprot:CAMPEP_0198304604 /NCGR_PEP_ID=MMETSP1449-20131203/57487_1 /TAXON_ID=420275 /ORGANISM="Attheya septentrionalis, Strain CCMP2084" /LENGTH=632 /DNA_ID=CAMNT_0044007131 /DNA_START=320 /DNA_END=2215 /DNA_ORIENTATION=-
MQQRRQPSIQRWRSIVFAVLSLSVAPLHPIQSANAFVAEHIQRSKLRTPQQQMQPQQLLQATSCGRYFSPQHSQIIPGRSSLYLASGSGEGGDSGGDNGKGDDSQQNSKNSKDDAGGDSGGNTNKKSNNGGSSTNNNKGQQNANNSNNKGKQRNRRRSPSSSSVRFNTTNISTMVENTHMLKRITQLERLVASQAVEIRKLRDECRELTEAASAFAQVVELLREAGLTTDVTEKIKKESVQKAQAQYKQRSDDDTQKSKKDGEQESSKMGDTKFEYFDDEEIFGSAPTSVIDAADAAGAAILAAMLGGKQRMLVDVRDAELTRDPEILVQFIELAILPVAAGLEGLRSSRNRVKIVFPTVSQLLQYRKSMALSAPEVVSLSTLGFDPVEKKDNLVVIIAPSPDDYDGLRAMNELFEPTLPGKKPITQPVVVLNHHMVPVSGPAVDFEIVYHLRLLSVQYMSGDRMPEYIRTMEREQREAREKRNAEKKDRPDDENSLDNDTEDIGREEDVALEAAMEHARESGVHQGITRAMVIRAYPRPWHVFVDTSPDSNADFEVAATFDEPPSQDDVNYAIVECLEGSEREDELVAQQMQQALEDGQLNKVSDILGINPKEESNDESTDSEEDEEEDNW